jgi:predicted DNA binding CopG/RHH family protein
MNETARRSTVYFEPELHRALRVKAAQSQRTVSEIVNEAVRFALREDEEDLAAIKSRSRESTMTYEQLLEDLKSHGKI